VIAAAQAAGFVAAGDVEIIAVRAWSQAHGLAVLWLNGNLQTSESYPDLDSLVHAVFSGGLGGAPPAPVSKPARRARPKGR
jgi:hypothetical protein